MGQMSTRIGGTEIGKFWVPIGTGVVDVMHGLVPEGKHPSGLVLSSNPPVG